MPAEEPGGSGPEPRPNCKGIACNIPKLRALQPMGNRHTETTAGARVALPMVYRMAWRR